MRFQESGGRARLFFPSEIRDRYSLEERNYLAVRIECDEGDPVATLTPTDDKEGDSIVRPVVVQSNGQARVDFPKQVAESLDMLGKEIRLEGKGNSIVVHRPE